MGILDRMASRAAGQALGKVLSDAINNSVTGGQSDRNANANGQGQAAFNAQSTLQSVQSGGQYQMQPKKPSVKRSYQLYLGDDSGDYCSEASFMLSGDFVLSKTNAGEIDVMYIYDPACNDEYTPYELGDNRPYFMIAPDIDEVFCSVNEYCDSGKIGNAVWVQPVQSEGMLFRAKFDYYGDFMIMYGFKRSDGSPSGLCLVYKKDIEGTPLLGRLSDELEEASLTYGESRIGKEN